MNKDVTVNVVSQDHLCMGLVSGQDHYCTTSAGLRGNKVVSVEGGGPDELCTGLGSGLNDSCMGLKSEDKYAGDIHKWRKEVNVKKTWCKLSSGLFGWRRQRVTSWRHEETGSRLTNDEYTSYWGRTGKGNANNFLRTFNSTDGAALPTRNRLYGQRGLEETSRHPE
jgi:hypothetical protein